LPPPGWYPDPRGTDSWWWDGWQWIVPPASQPPERMTPASQPPESMTPFKVVDVPGSRHRRVAGPSAFEETIKALPLGPLHVTLRFQPNEVNPYAIGAYVDEVQVGWLQTEWTSTDPHVAWVKRLHDARIRPRFEGECVVDRYGRDIDFNTPLPQELTEVADELLAQHGDN